MLGVICSWLSLGMSVLVYSSTSTEWDCMQADIDVDIDV